MQVESSCSMHSRMVMMFGTGVDGGLTMEADADGGVGMQLDYPQGCKLR